MNDNSRLIIPTLSWRRPVSLSRALSKPKGRGFSLEKTNNKVIEIIAERIYDRYDQQPQAAADVFDLIKLNPMMIKVRRLFTIT